MVTEIGAAAAAIPAMPGNGAASSGEAVSCRAKPAKLDLHDKGPTTTLVQTAAWGKGHLTSVLIFFPQEMRASN